MSTVFSVIAGTLISIGSCLDAVILHSKRHLHPSISRSQYSAHYMLISVTLKSFLFRRKVLFKYSLLAQKCYIVIKTP